MLGEIERNPHTSACAPAHPLAYRGYIGSALIAKDLVAKV
jgi:hypothetical protein